MVFLLVPLKTSKPCTNKRGQHGTRRHICKQVKHSGARAGDKHTDGHDLHLLVTATGKYWRLNYRFHDKKKTLALDDYPEVSIVKARKRREAARELLAEGVDPCQIKRSDKQVRADATAQTF